VELIIFIPCPAFSSPVFSVVHFTVRIFITPLIAFLALSDLSLRISVAAATHIGVRYSLVICQVAIMTDRRDRCFYGKRFALN